MHVGGITVDWLLQIAFTAFVVVCVLLLLVKNSASKYFEVDASFDEGGGDGDRRRLLLLNRHRDSPRSMPDDDGDYCLSCASCGVSATKTCSRCKSVRYCSSICQSAHWISVHKSECKNPAEVNSPQIKKNQFGLRRRNSSGVALVPCDEFVSSKPIKKPGKVLFPYDEFVLLYNSDKPGFPPCGLLNCGNSCFANAVLQCLTSTRPLVAYLLEKGHKRECRRNDWCFLCAFQDHVDRASRSLTAFSPMNILSRLPNIGGSLGHGQQEDAHEFMRFAIDTMQSVCLDEFGGEKAVEPLSQETTLIQLIFGGHLQSQVICTRCNRISNQLENMMDLTVEIHGDADSLEECLDQFTAKEWLHGDNMYKCDGCNDYVKAWKRLTIRRAPNILTIALKRFQTGRFGKLNKSVTFPETLDLSPYMSEGGDGTDFYKLYAVVVHLDMLNASFFGHYICYTKDFRGKWYRIDDCKVVNVDLEEVLSQGAYMLLYSRVSVRPSCLRPLEPPKEHWQDVKVEPNSHRKENGECSADLGSINARRTPGSPEPLSNCFQSGRAMKSEYGSVVPDHVLSNGNVSSYVANSVALDEMEDVDKSGPDLLPSGIEAVTTCNEDASAVLSSRTDSEAPESMDIDSDSSVSMEGESFHNKNLSFTIGSRTTREDSGVTDLVNPESGSGIMKDVKIDGSTWNGQLPQEFTP